MFSHLGLVNAYVRVTQAARLCPAKDTAAAAAAAAAAAQPAVAADAQLYRLHVLVEINE